MTSSRTLTPTLTQAGIALIVLSLLPGATPPARPLSPMPNASAKGTVHTMPLKAGTHDGILAQTLEDGERHPESGQSQPAADTKPTGKTKGGK